VTELVNRAAPRGGKRGGTERLLPGKGKGGTNKIKKEKPHESGGLGGEHVRKTRGDASAKLNRD